MPLYAICGNQFAYNMGNMKTYFMTLSLVLDYLNDINIYANYQLNEDYLNYTHIDDIFECVYEMEHAKNACFNIDELSTWFDCYSRPSDKTGTKALTDLAKQTRKLGIKCRYTAQYFGQINKALRALTREVYIIQKYHYIDSCYVPCYDDYCYNQHYIGIQKHVPSEDGLIPMSKEMFIFAPVEIFNVYDTEECINKTCNV